MDIPTNKPITVTQKQNEYLKALALGPKTTKDLMLQLKVSGTSVAKILTKLRDAGLVSSAQRQGRGNTHIHELTALYCDTRIIISTNRAGTGIPDEEIFYAAILRNAGLIGQRLTNQYRKVYPDRNAKSILSVVVPKAVARGLYGGSIQGVNHNEQEFD